MNDFNMQEKSLEELKSITGGALEDQEKGAYEKLVQELMEKYKNLTPEEIEMLKKIMSEKLKNRP